ncbi:MAG: hypothetical protein ACRCS9_15675 [Hyphomicrobium sp.]
MTASASKPGVSIGAVNSTITFEDDVITARPIEQIRAEFDDIERIRGLLRPIIIDLMDEEFARYRRIRG